MSLKKQDYSYNINRKGIGRYQQNILYLKALKNFLFKINF